MSGDSPEKGRTREAVILDHAPKPGPLHWDWRCLRCSEPCANHGGWWARLRYRQTRQCTDQVTP